MRRLLLAVLALGLIPAQPLVSGTGKALMQQLDGRPTTARKATT